MNQRYWAGVIQLDTNESYEENMKTACELIAEGAARGAKLLTLPEREAVERFFTSAPSAVVVTWTRVPVRTLVRSVE